MKSFFVSMKFRRVVAVGILVCLTVLLASLFTVVAQNSEEEPQPNLFTVTVEDEEITYDFSGKTEGAQTAGDYIDAYANNLTNDPDFEVHKEEALAIKRESTALYATFWALVPPLIAIALALITKEVYSSLFIGIVSGAVLYAIGGFTGSFGADALHLFEGTVYHAVVEGFIANVASPSNIGILIFLVLLGALVAMMNKTGGSAAFGRFAAKHIHSRTGAQLATMVLGLLIFVDDYFNCLTVGSVMRPVTDKCKISRAKLAYLIDSTAAPVCIIAPISSWAAAVAGFAKGAGAQSGMSLFISAIPFNFYAILTLVMMITLSLLRFDFGSMKMFEQNAVKGDLFTTGKVGHEDTEKVNEKGRVFDLIIPVVVLIVLCTVGMIYSGGFFGGYFAEGKEENFLNFIGAFSQSEASIGLALGSFGTVVFAVIYYLCRRVISFKDCMDSIPEGFKAMVPAILILVCAWTLNSMTESLGAKIFISNMISGSVAGLQNLLPAIIFLIGVGLSFATGTSWGTFGILIPIVLTVFDGSAGNMTVIAVSACMAGAVCGDHCSPISDTTIMASAGAQCNHVNHVSTQLPYALLVAAVSFVNYVIAGFVQNAWISLPIAIVMMVGVLVVIRFATKNKEAE